MVNLHEICEFALKKSKADQTEVFCINGKMRNVYIDNSEVKIVTNNAWIGLGVKTVLSSKIGYFSSTIRSIEDVESVVNNSLNIARVSPKDSKFRSLPEPKVISGSVERVYDEESVSMEDEEIIIRINDLISEAERDDIKVMTGLLRVNEFHITVMNSLGVDFSHKGTIVYLHITAKKNLGEGVIKRFSTSINDIDFIEAGKELKEMTKISSESITFHGKERLEVIIHPQELAGLMRVITTAANGEYINRRMSPWIGKLGEEVASESLSVIDDGRLKGGLRSSLADDEGVPTSRKFIIERGVLKNYLFDSYNANIFGVESTGNGFRRGITSIEDSHTRTPNCSSSNVIIEAGEKSLDSLISETEKGVLIYKFAYPQADPITGNFSLEIRNAVLIENGSLSKSIKHALFVGNMYEALKNITGIGNKLYNYENYLVPYIRFGGLQIVGM